MDSKLQEHDFDWVTARHHCSVPNEFARLRSFVENNCATRRECLGVGASVQFSFENGDRDIFSVTRTQPEGRYGEAHRVKFLLRHDHIAVVDTWRDQTQQMTLTLTLNDDGECRFLIDGEGEYLRWQVARRALCPLFFPDPTAG